MKGEEDVQRVRRFLETMISSEENIEIEDHGTHGFVMRRVYPDVKEAGPKVVAYTENDHGMYVVIETHANFKMDVDIVKSACETAACDYFVRY